MIRECPFCGERSRIYVRAKRMRRGDGEWPVKYYAFCQMCKARGPLSDGVERAMAGWNGKMEPPINELDLFNQGGRNHV